MKSKKPHPAYDVAVPEATKRILSLIPRRGQGAFARQVGISPQSLNNILRGRNEPNLKVYEAISRATGRTVRWLSTGEGPETEWEYRLAMRIAKLLMDAAPLLVKLLKKEENLSPNKGAVEQGFENLFHAIRQKGQQCATCMKSSRREVVQ